MSLMSLDGGSAIVTIDNPDARDPIYDEDSGTLQTPLDDGSVEISFGAAPRVERKDAKFEDNLAEDLDEAALGVICERLLQGIEQDLQSRLEWLTNMQAGISLLGLQVKVPRGAAASGGTPTEGVSTVDHPLLLEAVLRFQANARGELLPTDGPVKVRNDGEGNDVAEALADALQKDLNHYLTKVATEYYPDTDRMLLMLGFCGIAFKKGYHDPIKRRPVIASISAEDLIVSNASTNLEGAGRITHRIMMKPSLMKRMQLAGAYRKIDLPQTGAPIQLDAVKTKINQVQGIAPAMYVDPADQDRELYECYCEIEVPGFEHKEKGEATGLPLPYKVTIDKDARRILEIRRNWDEDDPMMLPRNRIIAYIFVPGLGFYGIGLLNVLGNATKAVTAAWRLMLDAGMFANFPGFLYLKSLAKQLTNQFRVPPGGGMAIDSQGGQDIRAMVMPLPYKDPSPVFIQLIENIATTAQRVGGTAELQVGEGKQDAPVGTTLAMIEQATKLISAVHKRLHWAQGQEFDMLKGLLMEDPEALWRHNKKKSRVLKLLTQLAGQQDVVAAEEAAEDRHRAMFLAALADCELTPAADPNTSSQTERYLKVVAARQMAATNPQIDINKVDEKAFHTIGWDNPEQYFKPAPAGPQGPSPEELTAQATIMAAQARVQDSQTKKDQAALKAQSDAATMASKERIANMQVARELVIHNSDKQHDVKMNGIASQDAATERSHKLALAGVAARNARQIALENNAHAAQQGMVDRAHEAAMGGRQMVHEGIMAHNDRVADLMGGFMDRRHEFLRTVQDQSHERQLTGLEHEHESAESALDRRRERSKPAAKRSMGGRVEAKEEGGSLHDALDTLIKLQMAPRIIDRDEIGRVTGAHVDTSVLRPKPSPESQPTVSYDEDGETVLVELPETDDVTH